jgi:hypothetical protein
MQPRGLQEQPQSHASVTVPPPTDHREFAGQPQPTAQGSDSAAAVTAAHRARGRGRLLLARGQGCRRRAPRLLLAAWWWHHRWWAAAALGRPRILGARRLRQFYETGLAILRPYGPSIHLAYIYQQNIRALCVYPAYRSSAKSAKQEQGEPRVAASVRIVVPCVIPLTPCRLAQYGHRQLSRYFYSPR